MNAAVLFSSELIRADKIQIRAGHQNPGKDPGCRVDGKQHMERRECPEDGPDPQDPEDAGSEHRQQGRRHGPPHPAEGGSGDLIGRGNALEKKDAAHQKAVATAMDYTW